MEQTLINTPKLHLRVQTGAEGPSYDPYSFTEYRLIVGPNEVILHQGLLTWLKVNGTRLSWPSTMRVEEYERECQRLFETCAGYTLTQLERFARKAKSRCHCGCHDFESVAGFPGESIVVCLNCGHVIDSYFDRSAIE